VKVGFLSEIWYSLLHVHICFFTAGLPLNTASCVTEPVPGTELQAFSFFFFLIALYWGEKEGTRQIIQHLTPTRRGTVPASLST